MPPTFTRDIQPALLWDTRNPPPGLPLRGCHPLRRGIPADFGFTIRRYRGPNTTSPLPFGKGFGLPCAVFGRPYSRHRYCFLFLRVLRCFNSPRSRSLMGSLRVYRSRKSHSGIPGSTAPCAYPGLIAAWHALPRRPSPAIHQAACSSSLRPGCVCTTSLEHYAPRFLPIGLQGNRLAHKMNGPGGTFSWPAFEPTTSALQGRRSSTDLPAHSAEALANLALVDRIAKEVIHPQVPLRIPCYDLAPLAEPGFELAMPASPHPDPTRLA